MQGCQVPRIPIQRDNKGSDSAAVPWTYCKNAKKIMRESKWQKGTTWSSMPAVLLFQVELFYCFLTWVCGINKVCFSFSNCGYIYCNIVPCQSALLCPSSFFAVSTVVLRNGHVIQKRDIRASLAKITRYRQVKRKYGCKRTLLWINKLCCLLLSMFFILPASCCRSRAEGW